MDQKERPVSYDEQRRRKSAIQRERREAQVRRNRRILGGVLAVVVLATARSEERRVGKECRL